MRVLIKRLIPSTRRARATVMLVLAALLFVGTGAAACDNPPSQRDQDAAASQQSVDSMIANQPIAVGQYSPSRDTLNAWVKTWESAPGKKAYTYLYMQGQLVGYYVLTGPPVSYAIGGTQPYRTVCRDQTGCVQEANPGQDATFANQGSGQFQWYGQDAQTHRMLEFGGAGVTYLLSDKPLPVPAPPLGDAK